MKTLFKTAVTKILTAEAKLLLKKAQPTIVAITGSVAKTSTKDAIYTVLRTKHHARKSIQSYNSELGVPLAVLGLESGWQNPFVWLKNCVEGLLTALSPKDYPKILVLEIGVDRPGDMERLTSWIHPDVVVLTHLPDVPSHIEFFDSDPEAITKEKMKLVHALKPEGTLVYNQDDARVEKSAEDTLQKSIAYSRYSPSAFQGKGEEVQYADGRPVGTSFTLLHADKEEEITIKDSLGVQHVYNCAAAVAVGSLFDIDTKTAAEALSSGCVPPPGRMRLIRGEKETMIIDDTINASPLSMQNALRTLKQVTGVKRRIAVLGDMLELGRESAGAHQAVGKAVVESADMLFTIGIRARGIAEGALANGMSPKNILQYETTERAGRELEEMLEAGDIILIKGSQKMRMERIVEEVMAEPQNARELLVRQNPEWKDV
ncbi:UDP-N-acetylmuramoyl-tripeptide--D-alanyl-D-alanine ligase [Candidatus Kaiserbacteria bacterium]|nr:UDP-N-acetylmuramoyl-tripeptide--D-alanyl-D-alanine ligase [Candidatus Kaiserbacteria bacterium]